MTPLIWAIAALAQPSNIIAVLAIAGAVALVIGWRRAGSLACGLAAVGLVVFGFLPTGALVLRALENRFPQPALPDRIDGIVVLGGYLDTVVTAERGRPELLDAADRIVAVADLARRYPGAPIVLTGGNKFEPRTGRAVPEAESAAEIARSIGIDPTRLVLETGSRSTWENATGSMAIVRPGPGSTWLLVTSAAHMPRAVGTFRAAGWPGLVPWPVDYHIPEGADLWLGRPDALAGLAATDAAMREIEALVAYRLAGRSSALFPAP